MSVRDPKLTLEQMRDFATRAQALTQGRSAELKSQYVTFRGRSDWRKPSGGQLFDRSYDRFRPKNNRSHGSTSENSMAFPVEMRNAFMFSVKPSPANTTIPGIGHATMS